MKWKELNTIEFKEFKKESRGVAIIPYGCLEKHGYHLPLGTDMYISEAVAVAAAEKEPALVVPAAPYGVISEAQHKEGCLSISSKLQYAILEELCDELARNGYDKIIVVNGHGGNCAFLKYFCQSRLEREHPYVVYTYDVFYQSPEQTKTYLDKFGQYDDGGHADLFETSQMMVIREDLVHMKNVLDSPLQYGVYPREHEYLDKGLFTAIWWYSKYPEHFAGNPVGSNTEKGKYIFDSCVDNLANIIKFIKENKEIDDLMVEFYGKRGKPEI